MEDKGISNMMAQPEHAGVDVMGTEILAGDTIIDIFGEIVLEKNLEDFLIEHLGTKYSTAI